MLAKRRLFGALLFMLTLLSSAACAKLNLKPYEVPSASGTEVEILAPEVYLLLHDSPLNGKTLSRWPTCLIWIIDFGEIVLLQCPVRLASICSKGPRVTNRIII